MKRIISIWILLLCAGISKVQAQNDATLAGMILVYTNKAEKELKNQEKVMLMQTTGHVWTKEEVEGTTDLQREFNNYLNSFRSISPPGPPNSACLWNASSTNRGLRL